VARGDDVHVRPDHHVVADVEAAKVIESAVLIDEDIAPNTGVGSAGCVDGGISTKLVSTVLPISSLNRFRISSASLNVKRLSAAVMVIARLTSADMAADSGVFREIILVRLSEAIRLFCSDAGCEMITDRKRVRGSRKPLWA